MKTPTMKATHTPGPWITDREREVKSGIVRDRDFLTEPDFIWSSHACAPLAKVTHGTRCDANARLIAAAPELLALAESIAPQSHMWFPGNPQLEALLNGWIEQARAVVLRATGEDHAERQRAADEEFEYSNDDLEDRA